MCSWSAQVLQFCGCSKRHRENICKWMLICISVPLNFERNVAGNHWCCCLCSTASFRRDCEKDKKVVSLIKCFILISIVLNLSSNHFVIHTHAFMYVYGIEVTIYEYISTTALFPSLVQGCHWGAKAFRQEESTFTEESFKKKPR